MSFTHIPVLYHETIQTLDIKPEGVYIDGTAGGGGHSEGILQKLTTGRLISIDQDPDAINAVTQRLSGYDQSIIVHNNFSNISLVAQEQNVYQQVDGILLDIGVSSHQLDTAQRGFSYHTDAPLDMRMSQKGISAKDLVNSLTWQELAELINRYGEDKFARSIAKSIVSHREVKEIETTAQLTQAIKEGMPASARWDGGHPARKTFQALRIAVNGELDVLQEGLEKAFDTLKVGGRLVVITFHSLEDRIVKQQMNKWCQGCVCPPEFPVCTCGNTPQAKLLWRKPKEASEDELKSNPRSRSAKLRCCIKLK